jgi:hypothetical protein
MHLQTAAHPETERLGKRPSLVCETVQTNAAVGGICKTIKLGGAHDGHGSGELQPSRLSESRTTDGQNADDPLGNHQRFPHLWYGLTHRETILDRETITR